MAFGDTLRLAYQQASELQRESAKRVASGIDWVGKQSDAIAAKTKALAVQGTQQLGETIDWLSRKTDEEIKRANTAAHQLAAEAERKAREYASKAKVMASQTYEATKTKATSTAQAAKAVYQNVKKTTTNAVSSTATATCNLASKAKQAVTNTLDKGLANAAASNREDKKEWEFKSKAGSEADRRTYKTVGDAERPKPFEPKFEAKAQVATEKNWWLYGDEDNNIKVGVYKSAGALGYEHDFNDNRDIYGAYGEKYVAGVTAQGKASAAHGLVEAKANAELFSAKASGMLAFVKGPDFTGVKAEAGLEANLVKGTLGGQLNVTPKTVYDNTLGHAVGLIVPEWAELPAWTDHGIFIGAEGELGVGAALKGTAQVNMKNMSVKAGGVIGVGPMAGLYATFGIK